MRLIVNLHWLFIITNDDPGLFEFLNTAFFGKITIKSPAEFIKQDFFELFPLLFGHIQFQSDAVFATFRGRFLILFQIEKGVSNSSIHFPLHEISYLMPRYSLRRVINIFDNSVVRDISLGS